MSTGAEINSLHFRKFGIALTILVLGAWTPMIMASFFPITMRLVHGLELTGDSVVHSMIIVWLLGLDIRKTE
jgi:hypothetical protein